MVCSGGLCKPLDVLVDGERIAAVGEHIAHSFASVIDLSGLYVSHGFIDLHVHLREPGFPHKESVATGTLAAAAGGFTAICAMPNLNPVPDSPAHLEAELAIIREYAHIEVLPYASITVNEAGESLVDFEALAPLCPGFSDDGKGVQRDGLMREAMRRVRGLGGLVAAHCEDDGLKPPGGCVHQGAASRRFLVPGIPSACEARQVARDLALVRETGVRYHVCHVSAEESVALIREAKREGLPVTAECTPHQMFFTDEDIGEDDGRFKMNPPLRGTKDREAILQGLLDGTIDCIATDHAPHARDEKSGGLRKSAFGVVGLETAFAACYTAMVESKRCDLPFLLSRMTERPAAILGRTAEIRPGARADLTILDTETRWRVNPANFLSMGRATPFAGKTLTGRVMGTWYRGRLVYDGGLGKAVLADGKNTF